MLESIKPPHTETLPSSPEHFDAKKLTAEDVAGSRIIEEDRWSGLVRKARHNYSEQTKCRCVHLQLEHRTAQTLSKSWDLEGVYSRPGSKVSFLTRFLTMLQ